MYDTTTVSDILWACREFVYYTRYWLPLGIIATWYTLSSQATGH